MTDDVPTFVALRELHRRGFRALDDPLPLEWSDGSPKHFGHWKTDFVNRRHFLMCLINWESLRDKGLTALPTNQPHAFYKLLMKAPEPSQIPLKLSNAEYISICDGGPIPQPVLPVEDFEEQEAIEDHIAALEIDDVVCVARPAKRRRTVTGRSLAASSSTVVTVCSTEVTDPNEVSASASSVRQGHNQATGVFIGSKQVFLEQHLIRGQKGAYCRFILACSKHTGADVQSGKSCKKHRNVDVSLGVQGVRESLAFLVAWALASNNGAHSTFQVTSAMLADALAHSMHVVSGDIERLASQVNEF